MSMDLSEVETARSSVTQKFQTTIPQEIRGKMGITEGNEEVKFIWDGERTIIKKVEE